MLVAANDWFEPNSIDAVRSSNRNNESKADIAREHAVGRQTEFGPGGFILEIAYV